MAVSVAVDLRVEDYGQAWIEEKDRGRVGERVGEGDGEVRFGRRGTGERMRKNGERGIERASAGG